MLPFLLSLVSQTAETPAATGWDTFLTLWAQGLGTLVVGLFGWLGAKFAPVLLAFVKSKTDNQLVNHAFSSLELLRQEVHAAVVMVNETLKKEIMKAKDPASEGGTSITKGEGERLKAACWASLQDAAGGWQGLITKFGHIAMGDGNALTAKIDTLIENEVAKLKDPSSARAA